MGGFDDSLRDYGGEDWDVAARAFNNGAVLVHEPRAVAWHDGPDWAGRDGDGGARNGQTVRLAERITDPRGRGAGVIHRWPETVVRLRGRHDDDLVIATVVSVLDALVDVRVNVDHAGRRATDYFAHDPRVQVGAIPDDVALRARTQVELARPAVWRPGALARSTGGGASRTRRPPDVDRWRGSGRHGDGDAGARPDAPGRAYRRRDAGPLVRRHQPGGGRRRPGTAPRRGRPRRLLRPLRLPDPRPSAMTDVRRMDPHRSSHGPTERAGVLKS